MAYSALAWRDTVQDGISHRIDLEDRLWYAVAPAIGYLLEAAAGFLLTLQNYFACVTLALAMVTLLLAAIHNAWDITIWSVTRRQES